MPATFTRHRMRIALDVAKAPGAVTDKLNGGKPWTWRGVDTTLELLFTFGATLIDVSTLASLSIYAKPATNRSGTTQFGVEGIVTFDNTVTQSTWDADTAQHVSIDIDDTLTNLTLGADKLDFWLVVVATTTGGNTLTLGGFLFTVHEDGSGNPGTPAGDPNYYTAAQCDSLFVSITGETMTGLLQFSGTTHAGLRLNNLTTTQRNALATPTAGMTIWNTTTTLPEYYSGSAWAQYVTNPFAQELTITGTGLIISNASPRLRIKDSNAALDEKIYDFLSSGTSLYLTTVSDSEGNCEKFIEFFRSGYTVSSIWLGCALNASTNIGLGTTTFGTSADGVIGFLNGVAPSTSPADTVQIYAADRIAGKSSLMVRVEDGTILRLGDISSLAELNLTTALAAIYGGTGQTSYAVGDILYASTTTALSKLADVATGNALISGGVNTAPAWGKIALTTHVSGILPIANGGTNAATAADARTNLSVPELVESSSRILARSQAGSAYFDGVTASTRVYSTLTGYSVGTNGVSLYAGRVLVPSSNPSNSQGIVALSSSTTTGEAARGLVSYFSASGTLVVLLYGATTADFRLLTYAGIVTGYGGKLVDIVIVKSGNTLTTYINAVAISGTESDSGGGTTPPAWSETVTSTYLLVGIKSATHLFKGTIGFAGVANLALSASDVLSIYQHGIPFDLQWGNPTDIINASTLNGGFETAGGGGADAFANWAEAVGGTSTVNRDTVVFRSGAASSRFDVDASGSVAQVSQAILTLGKRFAAEFYAQHSGAGLKAVQYNIGGATADSSTGNVVDTTWTRVSVSGIATGSTFSMSRGSGQYTSLSLWLDDVIVRRVGFVCTLDMENARPSAEMVVRDRSSNNLHATVVGGVSQTKPTSKLWLDDLYVGNNVGLSTTTFGTNAAKVLGIANGTAPTTSPADLVQLWSADQAAGQASLYLRDEVGNTSTLGANIGFYVTAWGTSAAKVLGLGSGTAPSTSPADMVQIYSKDRNADAGRAGLHIRGEDGTVSVIGDNICLGTAVVSNDTGASPMKHVLAIALRPVGMLLGSTDVVQLFCEDRAAGKAGLSICTEDNTRHHFSDRVNLGTVTPEGMVHIYQTTATDPVLILEANQTNDNTKAVTIHHRGTTSNATPTVIGQLTIAANTAYHVRTIVVARRTGGTGGTANDSASYEFDTTCKLTAGIVVILNQTPVHDGEDQALWVAVHVSSGSTTLDIQVTGAADNDIVWHAHTTYFPVST